MKHNAFQIFASALFFVLVETAFGGSVALPDFSIIGQGWGHAEITYNKELPTVFPKQVTTDYNLDGVVYGIVYEYRYSNDIFDKLKAEIQKTIQVESKMLGTKMVVWRNEDQKLTISLIHDKDTETIKLIVVSIDKSTRRN